MTKRKPLAVNTATKSGAAAGAAVRDGDMASSSTLDEVLIPHEVVGYMAREGLSAIAAWRKYRGLSQAELGARMGGLSLSGVARLEAVGSKPQQKTLARAAVALGVDVEQLKI